MAELEVIGCRAGSPGPCGPASGYLLRTDDLTLLIDCGPGVVASLARDRRIEGLSGVVISHPHADHIADLIALAYHRSFPLRMPPLPLFGPSELLPVLELVDRAFGIPSLEELRTPIASAIDFHTLAPDAGQEVLGLALRTSTTKHPITTLALGFPSLGLTYTADGALTDKLVEFASGSDLLIAEATYLDGKGRDLEGHGHMTGEGAGELARRASVRRLMVTHFADCAERAAIRQRAERSFGAPVIAATPGRRVSLTARQGA